MAIRVRERDRFYRSTPPPNHIHPLSSLSQLYQISRAILNTPDLIRSDPTRSDPKTKSANSIFKHCTIKCSATCCIWFKWIKFHCLAAFASPSSFPSISFTSKLVVFQERLDIYDTIRSLLIDFGGNVWRIATNSKYADWLKCHSFGFSACFCFSHSCWPRRKQRRQRRRGRMAMVWMNAKI